MTLSNPHPKRPQTVITLAILVANGILPLACRRSTPPTPGVQPSTQISPLQFDSRKLAAIESAVNDAIRAGRIPGAVVLVGTAQRDLFRRAFGARALKPQNEPMTVDTVFDLASLTKTVATATAVMLLQQDQKLSVQDPVTKFLPEFAAKGKQAVTIENLLLHTSGLCADNPLEDYERGPHHAMQAICNLELLSPPGQTFLYSDVGYILLAEIVRRVTDIPFESFVQDRILTPLAMADSGFRPPEKKLRRVAPSDQRDGKWIRGQVHDPRAYRLGGVAGHAGLFATADDLARFCRMILAKSASDSPVLTPETVADMTRPRPAGNDGCLRAYGWDVSSPYSSARGYLFEIGRSFGHTGFTGTSIWIDRDRDCFVILLTNRLHPNGKGNVIGLRRKIATIVADAVRPKLDDADVSGRYVTIHRDNQPPPANAPVLAGIDVLVRSDFAILKNRRVGLIVNHTAVDRNRTSTIQLLRQAPNVHLVAIFSPEHGPHGTVEQHIDDSIDGTTGLKVFSLYGRTKRPTPDMLAGIDTLVFDIQDIGTRFYTYTTTMRYAMEATADANLRFVVLDRPNPITGRRLFGPIADEGRQSFICPHPLPLVHGLTVGELAWLFNRQRDIRADLHIVAVNGWQRHLWFDQTHLNWINPSPNIRSLTQAILYPAVCLLERTNVSVGRGTEAPFEHFGAPWIKKGDLARLLNDARPQGVSFEVTGFTPDAGLFAGQACSGIRLRLTDRDTFDPARAGLTIVAALYKLHGQSFRIDRVDELLVSKKTLERLKAGDPIDTIIDAWSDQLAATRRIYRNYRIYE